MQRDTRGFGLAGAVGALAVGIAVIAGCSSTIEGTAQQNDVQAAEYAAEVTSSSIAASKSRAAAMLDEACSAFFERSDATVGTYNAFIDAANADAPDVDAKATEAANALRSAAEVAAEEAGTLPTPLAGLFDDYADTYRELAGAIAAGRFGADLNDLAHRGDDIKDAIGVECR